MTSETMKETATCICCRCSIDLKGEHCVFQNTVTDLNGKTVCSGCRVQPLELIVSSACENAVRDLKARESAASITQCGCCGETQSKNGKPYIIVGPLDAWGLHCPAMIGHAVCMKCLRAPKAPTVAFSERQSALAQQSLESQCAACGEQARRFSNPIHSASTLAARCPELMGKYLCTSCWGKHEPDLIREFVERQRAITAASVHVSCAACERRAGTHSNPIHSATQLAIKCPELAGKHLCTQCWSLTNDEVIRCFREQQRRGVQVTGPITAESAAAPPPIPLRLCCESCGELHIDEGIWATKPHHTHSCQHCGSTWRPAVVHTVGVRFLPGFQNEPTP